jgi:glycine cleavage system aminomethyltransferase T
MPTSGRARCAPEPMNDLYQLKRTPFHERTSVLCLPQNWRRWAGHIAVGSYDLGLEREYWAIRNHAALIDVSPLMKYLIEGPDAARLLDRLTPRNIAKLAIGQVYYTGWCDEDGSCSTTALSRAWASRASASPPPSRRCAGCT